jgi:hypothetical protein
MIFLFDLVQNLPEVVLAPYDGGPRCAPAEGDCACRCCYTLLSEWFSMSQVSRRAPKPKPAEVLKVWVRSGGRCAICNAYLLESDLDLRPVSLGEIAHNKASSDAGPRADRSLSAPDRNKAENLLLLCGSHHPDVDKKEQLDVFTVEQLAKLKNDHEAKIRLATERVGGQRTAILRLQGNVKGVAVDLGVDIAADAVIRSSNRFPELRLSHDRQGVEIDLRHLPGEDEGSAEYYTTAAMRIDEMIDLRYKPAVEKGAVEHLSVLAIARLPVLVYLGSRLDDTIPTEVYQRHRAGQTWVWGEDADDDPMFAFRVENAGVESPTEAAMIVNASGTIHAAELPADMAQLPRYVIEPDKGPPHPDTVRSRRVRDSFESALRGLLSHVEATNKAVRRLHVFAAAPVSVAVTLGRSVGWRIHPDLLVYDRLADGTYKRAMEVTAP